MQVMRIHDMVEENGKTIRENNLEIPHTIKVGSLVEINDEDSDLDGLRLFLVMHVRDCNGKPLSYLSTHLEDIYEGRLYERMTIGFRDEDLKVIKSA
jgi:hypothetical protein